MSGAAVSLLLACLAGSEAQATIAWKQWRASVDMQNLTWQEMQMLAVLNGPRFEEWLLDDPNAGVLKGIVRRSWSEAQVRLSLAREVATALELAGCGSVTLIGSVGAYLRNLQATSIRPILEIRLLIARRHLAGAAAVLLAQGWESRFDVTVGEDLDWNTSMYFSRNGAGVFLHWGVLRVDAGQAVACEEEFLAAHSVVETMGTQFQILDPEHALLEALSERDATVDVVPWQADAALILHEPIDWDRWTTLAARFQRSAFEHIPELRSMGFEIPVLQIPPIEVAPQIRTQPLSFVRTIRACRRAAGRWVRRISAVMVRQ